MRRPDPTGLRAHNTRTGQAIIARPVLPSAGRHGAGSSTGAVTAWWSTVDVCGPAVCAGSGRASRAGRYALVAEPAVVLGHAVPVVRVLDASLSNLGAALISSLLQAT